MFWFCHHGRVIARVHPVHLMNVERRHAAADPVSFLQTVIGYTYPQRFLSRVSILTRDIDIANLSVCPSVTFRYQMKTA